MRRQQISLSDDFDRPLEFIGIEEDGYTQGFSRIAGLDEVGRGPLAGPVVAAAVVLPRGFSHTGIKDSKQLSAKQRDEVAAVIRDAAANWAVGVVEVRVIDRINILQASLHAMLKAIRALKTIPDYLLIDGREVIPPGWFRRGKVFNGNVPQQKTLIKGDQRCLSIAAASILAKVARDAIMMQLDHLYPGYGFAEHKGYACAAHLKALRRLGPSPVHRRSFAPVHDLEAKKPARRLGPLFDRK